jgi:hypothetical protein
MKRIAPLHHMNCSLAINLALPTSDSLDVQSWYNARRLNNKWFNTTNKEEVIYYPGSWHNITSEDAVLTKHSSSEIALTSQHYLDSFALRPVINHIPTITDTIEWTGAPSDLLTASIESTASTAEEGRPKLRGKSPQTIVTLKIPLYLGKCLMLPQPLILNHM